MKKIANLKAFKNTLPYASEIFGVYQPLLGWKSKRTLNRFQAGFESDRQRILDALVNNFRGRYELETYAPDCVLDLPEISPGIPSALTSPVRRSVVINALKAYMPAEPPADDSFWFELINSDLLSRVLNQEVRVHYMEDYGKLCNQRNQGLPVDNPERRVTAALNKESAIAGALLYLQENRLFEPLKQVFYGKTDLSQLEWIKNLLTVDNPIDMLDPRKDLQRVGLSPIGIVHLFREYFFEFDTFLGTAVGHIWLSPGSTAELVEVSTRKTIIERSIENTFETIIKTEKGLTEQDELSEAVKEDNRNDIGLGINVEAEQDWKIGLGEGSASASASFDMKNTQQKAREQVHRRMRQQSEKLSTEIRKNYKSTFKTVTEITDTSSKHYILTNNTSELINYELRRKMRQVGVQVQDIGTYLCWQTYVDDPGQQLGVAQLVHIAKAPDLNHIPPPELVLPLPPAPKDVTITIPFVGIDTSDNDQAYSDGGETEVGVIADSKEHIESNFPQDVVSELAGYRLTSVSLDPAGADAKLSLNGPIEQAPGSNKARFVVHLDYVNFHEQQSITIRARLNWEPEQDLDAIKAENDKRRAEHTARVEQEYKKAFVEAARERIKLASNIEPRRFDDLREEERIVVYRKLIQELLTKGVHLPDDRTRHIVAELLNSIFDIGKMLYFVAPEWWRPRLHQSNQNLGGTISEENEVGWGGVKEKRDDNYYITEESAPAKLGSSLGWLLQLDGDNLRNAFLNAPWVKAVIPIRPGKEKAAINWLTQVEGMNGIGPGDLYTGDEPELQGKTMLEVLGILAEKVADKHQAALKVDKIADPDEPLNDDISVSATPVDRVYEHGFYPLQGGFRARPSETEDFEVFDQWVEILPTDQVVAVEVKYDSKTGRQV